MAKKVEKWESTDGRLFAAEVDAIARDLEIEVENIIRQYHSNSVTFPSWFQNAGELARFLVGSESLGDIVYTIKNNKKYDDLIMTPFGDDKCPHCGKY